jgi:hypothetical protein
MNWPAISDKLFSRAHPALVTACGLGILAGLYAAPRWLEPVISDEKRFQQNVSRTLEQTAAARERIVTLETLKTMDLEQLKAGLGGHAQSEKSLFESGISLQEERRLLEKQLEIMTTTLLINPALQRVFLMRADQPLQSYLISHIPLRSYGGAPDSLPAVVRIVSKERFAHPERGKSEEVNGTLQWIPPQVGTSVRSNALGEFVIFTNSALILHGPPVNAEDHERFPHICLGLDQEAARKLYRASFIGTRIILSHASIEKAEVLPSLTPGTTQATEQ